jgi:hypothetical protein
MKFRYILAAAALFSFVSCNEKEVFEKEQYKNIFGFVCESDNTKAKVVSLHLEEATTYVSISMGGSNTISQDVTINFEEDASLIDSYNSSNFDTDVAKYAIALPEENYDIESYSCTIKAGERLGVIPVKVIPNGLSVDETYFIPLRVTTYDNAEMDPEKGTILFQVGIKNHWAESTGTAYNMLGRRQNVTDFTTGEAIESTASEISMPGTKYVYPYANDEVRLFPGNETYSTDHHKMEQMGMIIEIGEDTDSDKVREVTLKPVRDLIVKMVEPSDERYDDMYNNTYSILDDGFNIYKTFLLQYYYSVDGKNFYHMKEEVRVEYKEDKDVDEGFEVIEYEE